MAIPSSREDELGKKWDRCIADTLLKFGGGILVGGVTSLILFKRRKWPVFIGAGFGVGLAYGNCERELKDVLTLAPASQKV
ncbi:MICOS complex subunit Mic10-like [Rhodnius prolixus]|uniref:MICOS complex subunit MIC10 n=1 Tax=Rhodnius prolixus TaxID=13249 RepID=T1HM68_RHOPR